jgi:hypothetical protein
MEISAGIAEIFFYIYSKPTFKQDFCFETNDDFLAS